jgi:23S rRNA pseudouridine1911/1915/1917 synthase
MVVAKSDQIHNLLAKQLQRRTLTREYLALVWGRLRPEKGTISIPIGRSKTDRRLMSSGSAKLREATTQYETIEDFDVLSFLKLHLLTGRTHQIRTHLKEVGHPVFGDPEYGGRESRLSGIEARHRQFMKKLLDMTGRQLLHAAKLAFIHPKSGQEVEFTAELPEDFGQILEVLRLNR